MTLKEEEKNIEDIHWLSDEDYAKAIGQLRLQIGVVLSVFQVYGQDIFIPSAINEIVKLAEDFGLRVRGIDKSISLELLRKNINHDRQK